MEDELGSGWMLGVHADDLENCLSAYSLAFDRRGPFTVEYRLRRSDGEYRWMLDTGAPITDDDDRFVGYIGSLLDITDRKETEAEREALLAAERAARSEAEHTNRLKDEFLSVLSHELRTPLNAVLGWVHLLQTSAGPGADVAHGLAVIERNARLQSRMVDDLLDMGGVMAGKMRLDLRPIGLDQVIERALESLKPEFDKKPVHVHTHLDAETPPVLGDLGRLQQIAWNLLSNALKFTPAGGEVFVELRHETNLAQIVVRDTGDGIDPAFLPFVFERFRQGDASTRRLHGGLGIGLALVKSLAELHGGVVSAASAGPGRGATFTLALPADSSLELAGSDIRAIANSGGR
jgi:signal transduction histidine kinase